MLRHFTPIFLLCTLACGDAPGVALEPVGGTTVRFRIPALIEGPACFALSVSNSGRTWYQSPVAYWRSYHAMRDAGVLCAEHDFEHVVGAQPGRHTAQLQLISLYDGDARTDEYNGGWSMPQTFSVPEANTETVVQLDRVALFEPSDQGFVDIDVRLHGPRLDDTCMAIRIENGDGVIVATYPELCTDRYGTYDRLTYVTPCDAQSQPTRVRVVIDELEFAADVPLAERKIVNPCPPGDDTHSYWSAACVTEVTCLADDDVSARFDLALVPVHLEP